MRYYAWRFHMNFSEIKSFHGKPLVQGTQANSLGEPMFENAPAPRWPEPEFPQKIAKKKKTLDRNSGTPRNTPPSPNFSKSPTWVENTPPPPLQSPKMARPGISTKIPQKKPSGRNSGNPRKYPENTEKTPQTGIFGIFSVYSGYFGGNENGSS